MAHIIADRVLDTSTTTGTGAVTLAATPPTGYRTFSAVCSVSDTVPYVIEHTTTGEWEAGIGTYSSANTLTRTSVTASSNSGASVNFSAGTKNVFISITAAAISSDMRFASGASLTFGDGLFKLTHGGGGGLAITAGTLFYAGDSSPAANNISGFSLHAGGILNATRDSANPVDVNRKTNDGTIINIRQDGTTEGGISVSGTTLTYGTFCGSHWSQLHDGGILDIPRGTIVETIDDMCSWPGEANDQLARFKVSDAAGSSRVYGVFMDWHGEDLDSNDAFIASLGAFLVRIAANETVQCGDLIESNGDGCGRVQAGDIIRASTVCKITSSTVIETYDDGSYLVPCVLYCG